MKPTIPARLALVLSAMACSNGCGLLSPKRAETPQAPIPVVCAPEALVLCDRTKWLLPSVLSCDQVGELALAERAESSECRARHAALVECVLIHNGGAK